MKRYGQAPRVFDPGAIDVALSLLGREGLDGLDADDRLLEPTVGLGDGVLNLSGALTNSPSRPDRAQGHGRRGHHHDEGQRRIREQEHGEAAEDGDGALDRHRDLGAHGVRDDPDVAREATQQLAARPKVVEAGAVAQQVAKGPLPYVCNHTAPQPADEVAAQEGEPAQGREDDQARDHQDTERGCVAVGDRLVDTDANGLGEGEAQAAGEEQRRGRQNPAAPVGAQQGQDLSQA